MKKTIRVVAVAMIALVLVMALASCGAKVVSGTYKGEINAIIGSYEVVYEFSGNNVKVTRQVESVFGNSDPVVLEGTYELIEDADGELKIQITYNDEDDVVKGGKFDFEQGEDFIKINGAKYSKIK